MLYRVMSKCYSTRTFQRWNDQSPKPVDHRLKWVGFLQYKMELRLDNRSYQPRPQGLAKAWILLSGRPWERKIDVVCASRCIFEGGGKWAFFGSLEFYSFPRFFFPLFAMHDFPSTKALQEVIGICPPHLPSKTWSIPELTRKKLLLIESRIRKKQRRKSWRVF